MDSNLKPIISVIMPSLNVEDYIEESLTSVLNQTFDNIEVICVDAGSTDKTLEIIEKYQKNDNRIKILKSDKKSYGYQVNLGIKESDGIYIGIVETDDYIANDMFEQLYSHSQNNSVDIIKGTFYYFNDSDPENTILKKENDKRELTSDTFFTLDEEPLFIEGHPSIWAGIYLKEFLIANDIKFLEEPKGGWVDNPFFIETAIKARKIYYTNTPYYYYRTSNPNSSTNDLNDTTIPIKRILNIHDVLTKNNVTNENILKYYYIRLFRYIELVLNEDYDNIDNLDYDTCRLIQEALKTVDEKVVKEDVQINFKKLYYKFISPLLLSKFNDE